MTNRRILLAVLTVVVLFLGWRGLINVSEWQACGATGGQAVGAALGKGEPSTLECVGVALTKPAELTPTADSGFAGSAPVVTEDPAEPEVPVCGDPGLGAYSFTRDENGCELEVAESGAPADMDLPLPLPDRYAGAPLIGCSIDPKEADLPCTSVYIPADPDDGSCVELYWTGLEWQDQGEPAAALCPNHHGA